MTRHHTPPAQDANEMPAILIEAARCWREARDSSRPVQPSLFAMLSRHGHGMLAPVFDSIMTLAEGVFGKRIATGSGSTLSEDEYRLLDLFEGSGSRAGGGGLATALQCAVGSLRILLTRTLGTPVARSAA